MQNPDFEASPPRAIDGDASKYASARPDVDLETMEAKSIEGISVGLVGQGVLNRFGRFGQLVGTTLG